MSKVEKWSESFGYFLINESTYERIDPIIRTNLQNGLQRSRRLFGQTPIKFNGILVFTNSQATAFEQWYNEIAGVSDFYAPIELPVFGGADFKPRVKIKRCSFIDDGYQFSRISHTRWKFKLKLLVFPVLAEELRGWGGVPDYVSNSEIFDWTINCFWPEVKNE